MGERVQGLQVQVTVMAAALLLTAGVARVARAEDGKPLFERNCVVCHGATGKGDGPAAKMLTTPPGDLTTTARSMSAGDIAKMLKEGGSEGKKHPLFGKKLSDEQIGAVAQHVKELAK